MNVLSSSLGMVPAQKCRVTRSQSVANEPRRKQLMRVNERIPNITQPLPCYNVALITQLMGHMDKRLIGQSTKNNSKPITVASYHLLNNCCLLSVIACGCSSEVNE